VVTLCACGCGLPSRQKTLQGHHRRLIVARGYAEREGKLAHRLRAERALGHTLPAGAVVHHVDGTKSMASPLVICQDQTYHALLHRRTVIVRAGGNPNTDAWCSGCRKPLPRSVFSPAKTASGVYGYCRPCKAARERQRRPTCQLSH